VPRPRKIRRAHFILSSDERGTIKRQLIKLDLCGACKKTSSVDLCLLAKRQSREHYYRRWLFVLTSINFSCHGYPGSPGRPEMGLSYTGAPSCGPVAETESQPPPDLDPSQGTRIIVLWNRDRVIGCPFGLRAITGVMCSISYYNRAVALRFEPAPPM
jgi:hypothetical protein